MKKLIALLLISVMCLSFVACNNNDGSTNDNTTNENDSTIQYGVGESAFADHPLLPCIYGTWEFVSCNSPWDYTLYKTLTINHNGTCIVDDVAANWKINDDYTSTHILYIGLYVDNECIYGAEFSADYGGVNLCATYSDRFPLQTFFTCINPECLYSSIDNFGSLCDTWRANDSADAIIQTVVIDNSGKCVLDEQFATWDLYSDYTNGFSEPCQLGIVISIDGEAVYYGQLIGEDVFKLMDINGTVCGEYSKAGN